MADLIEEELQIFSKPKEVGFVPVILFSFSIILFFEILLFAPLVEFYCRNKWVPNFLEEF